MTATKFAALRRAALAVTPLALAMTLAACNSSPDAAAPPVAVVVPPPAPAPTPTPTPTPSPTSRNVTACINQVMPNTGGRAVASLAVPDALRLDFTVANGFPNGRQFNDPVIDITLAALLLDLTRHPLNTLSGSAPTFAGSLGPPNDNTGSTTTFPFLGTTNGIAQPAQGTGTTFNFRSDPASSYVRVDRMGNPAVATALIGSSLKNAFNDGNLADDVAGTYLGGTDGIVNQLTILHNALAAQLISLGLTPCST